MANEDVTDRLTSLEVIRRFRAHDYTLDDFVASRRERHPGREMMVFEGRSWSWQQVEETVQRMAFQLRADGVQAGDRIVVMGRNSPWHLLLLLAAARVGSIFVPINPQFPAQRPPNRAAPSAVGRLRRGDGPFRPIAESAAMRCRVRWRGAPPPRTHRRPDP